MQCSQSKGVSLPRNGQSQLSMPAGQRVAGERRQDVGHPSAVFKMALSELKTPGYSSQRLEMF